MDVVGGVIVAADHSNNHEDRASCGRRSGVKRGRCGDFEAVAMGALWEDPSSSWNNHHHSRLVKQQQQKKKQPEKQPENAMDRDEDYELRSVLSLYQPVSASPVFTKPARCSWVGPLRFLLKKELTTTDVGDLGRIILPKRDAECQLPHLDNKEGKLLSMEDYNSNKNWTLRYKWWPNNKSRMYVLESTGEFVKYYDLKEKDELIVYKDGVGNLVIRGQKWSSSPLSKTDSFLGSSTTPTGKRSPKGANSRSNLHKGTNYGSPTNNPSVNLNNSSAVPASVSSTSVFTTSGSSYGSANVGQLQPGNCEMIGTLGPLGIDWEKLPDPPAIEFSDPPAIEFPGEFECTWADCI